MVLRSSRGRFWGLNPDHHIAMTPRKTRCAGDDCRHRGGLGFGQSGSHHDTRVLRVYAVSVFRTSPVFPTGCGPMRLLPSGELGDPEVFSSLPPSSARRIWLSVMWRTVQAVELSPYRAGLAERHPQRLQMTPAFPTCSCPLWLSPSGQSDGPEVSLRTSLDCVKDSAPRPAAHTRTAPSSSN